MSKHLGNLTVTKDNVHSFPAVDEIYGHLTIAAGAELRAPKLTMVRGWVTLQAARMGDGGPQIARLTAPMLGLIDGWLTLGVMAEMSTTHLVEVRTDLTMEAEAKFSAEALKTIGSINLTRDVLNDLRVLPALVEVRENVTLMAGANLSTPLLERIGKSVTLREGARLGAPNLNYIGGYVDIDESAKLSAPRFIGG
jgi:hypothetical protein